MSAVGSAAWAIVAAAWSLCLFCHGIGYGPIDRNALPILATAMGVLFAAGIGDWIYYGESRRPARSRMKSFRVYLREPPEDPR